MGRYDYLEAIKDDIRQYIDEEVNFSDYESIDDLQEFLNEELWGNDSVTGNASGSYTCNTWTAEEYLCHNMDLLKEALREFGDDNERIDEAEFCDVTIRCYLLGEAIADVMTDIEDDFNNSKKDAE